MGRKIAYPSLSTKGWITDPVEIMAAVITNYFVARPSNDVSYSSHTRALPKTVAENSDNETTIRNAIRDDINFLLRNYFPSVDINVRVEYPFPDDYTRMGVVVSAVATTEDNRKYDLAQAITLADSKLLNIVRLNNDGTD